MFTENVNHIERGLFDDILLSLPEGKRKKALSSDENAFYREVFCGIEEKSFEVVFEKKTGRPNAPVNSMVGALVLRQMRSWTYEELFDQIDFNVLTRLALGMTDMAETPFCAATLFNFQNRLVEYEEKEGINLFEEVFEKLTAKQKKRFGVRGEIQRSDSFQAMTNVARYGRLKLMIEVVMRLIRKLEDEDKEKLGELIEPYRDEKSEGYVYRIEDGKLPAELKTITNVYMRLHDAIGNRYEGTPEYGNFDRLYGELIEIVDKEPRMKAAKDIKSGSLQSPDDPDATYSGKGGKSYVGHKVNVTETAFPGNELNLITDVAVDANNVADGPMLAARMDKIKERNPELNEMHTDGAYGGKALNPKMKEHVVFHVETGSNSGKAKVPMSYDKPEDGNGYTVTCPGGQTVSSVKAIKRFKAVFERKVCDDCPFNKDCKTKITKHRRVLYFKESWAESSIRSRNILKIPEERRTLRANVEATVREFSGMLNHKGKMPVRGRKRIRQTVIARAIGINFGRIRRQIQKVAENATIDLKIALKMIQVALFAAVFNQNDYVGLRPKNYRQ